MTEFNKIAIGKLFRIVKGKRLTRAEMTQGTIPFVGACIVNNGITAYIGNDEHVHPGNVITVAYNGAVAAGKAYYQPVPFWASDDVNVLYPKFEMTEEIGLYICAAIEKAGKQYDFDHKWDKDTMKKDEIVLPFAVDGMLDIGYMKGYIADLEIAYIAYLEAERASELEAYLDITGFDDFELTDEDRETLSKNPKTVEKQMGDMFKVLKGRRKLDKLSLSTDGITPVHSSDTRNNGIVGYTKEQPDYHVSDDTPCYVVFGDHTRTMNIARYDFCTFDNVKVLVPNSCLSDEQLLYILSVWRKAIPGGGYRRHWSIAKNAILNIPVTDDGEIDYDYMAAYIRVQEKLAIADAMRLKDRIIAETARIVA